LVVIFLTISAGGEMTCWSGEYTVGEYTVGEYTVGEYTVGEYTVDLFWLTEHMQRCIH
jgi:hypothetical protein